MAVGTKTLKIIITATDRQARRVFNSLKKGMSSVVNAGKKVGLGLAAGFGVAATAIVALTIKVLNLNDDLAKTADRLGVTTEELSAFRHQMSLAGASTKEADQTFKFLQRNISDAAQGVGEAAAAFEMLGINAEELKKKSPAEAMEIVTRKLEGVESAADKTSIAMDIFGRSGDRILNTTADAFAEARKEAELFGIAINRADAKQMENINDSLTRVKAAITGASIQLVKQFAPTLEAVGEKLVGWAKSGALSEWAKDLGKFLVDVIPKGLILVLDITSRLLQAFRGWGLLIGELKILWLGFVGIMQSAIETMAKGLAVVLEAANAGGIFDEQLKSLVAFAQNQEQINQQINKDKDEAIKKQNENIAGYQKEQASIEDVKKGVDDFVKSVNDGTSSVEKQVGEVDKLAEAWKRVADNQKLVSISSFGPGSVPGQRTFGDESLLQNLSRTEGE